MRFSILILVMAGVSSVPLAAQQPAVDVIPRELAVALLDRYGMSPEDLDIVVGRLPRSFPMDAILRGNITILGGLDGDRNATVVADVPEPPDSALARIASHLERAGWRRAAADMGMGGFVPSATARPASYCRANAILTFVARERQGTAGSRVRLWVAYPPPEAYSSCNRNPDQTRGRFRGELPSLPDLEAPAGTRMLGAGHGGGGPGSREANARLETLQSPAAIGEHYAEQLRRAGWTVGPATRGEETVLYRAQRQDDEKRNVFGVLTVLRVPDTQQLDVAFRVARVELPR